MIGLALSRSLRDFFSLRIIFLVLVPPTVSALFWIGLIWWNWTFLTSGLSSFFMTAEWFKPILRFFPAIISAETFNIVNVLAFVLMFVFLFPFVLITSVIAISILANPLVFSYVIKKHYPSLALRSAPLWRSLSNTLWASFLFLLLWFMSLPLWLIPGGAIAIPLFLAAFLNKKTYSFDALAELVEMSKMKEIEAELNSKFWLASLLCSALNFVPLALFISPILAALMFIHISGEHMQRRLAKA